MWVARWPPIGGANQKPKCPKARAIAERPAKDNPTEAIRGSAARDEERPIRQQDRRALRAAEIPDLQPFLWVQGPDYYPD